jgi:hypothetical protein
MHRTTALAVILAAVPWWSAGAQTAGTRRPAPRPEQPRASVAAAEPARVASTGTNTSLGLKAGTIGLSAELSRLLGDHIGVRAGVNVLRFSYERRFHEYGDGEILWDVRPKTTSFSGLIDLYPGARGVFRFTAGAMTSPLKGTGVGTILADPYQLEETLYPQPQTVIGKLVATARYPDVVPYVGLGFGTPAASHRGIGFAMDIGVAIGKPTVTLTSTNAATTTSPTLRRDLALKELEWREEVVDKIPVWPVLSLGLTYRF